MQNLLRGTIVGDAHGKLFVVWGLTGDCVSLMPTVKVGYIRRTDHIVRVRAEISADPLRIIAVDAQERKHTRRTDLLAMGQVHPAGLALLVADVTVQTREAAALEARDAKAKNERRVSNTICQARQRRLVTIARQIVSEMWPEQMAA